MTFVRYEALSETWFEALATDADPNRIGRAHDYLRRGRIREGSVAPGEVRALIRGSRREPYEVAIMAPLIEATALERAPVPLLAETLTARPDPASVDMLVDLVPELLLDPEELDFYCSCPDWASPCKHVIALGMDFGHSFAEDLGLFFLFRGLDTLTVLQVMTEKERRRRLPSVPGAPGAPPTSRARVSRGSPDPYVPVVSPIHRVPGVEPAATVPERTPPFRGTPGQRVDPSRQRVNPLGHRVGLREFWHGAPLPEDAEFHILSGADRAPEAALAPPLPWPRSGDHDPTYLDVIALAYDRMAAYGADDGGDTDDTRAGDGTRDAGATNDSGALD